VTIAEQAGLQRYVTIRLPRLITLLFLLTIAAKAQGQIEGFNPALAPPAPLNEKVLHLPGDPERPVTLEVTLYMPPGTGPFPLAVLNHGATNASAGNRGTRYRYTFNAYYFLSRGYAVALPMARGFAGSGGNIVHEGCALDTVGLENARDVMGVIEALRHQPGIDTGRIVIAGQSFGGWTTMALGTMDIPGVHGLIGFSPALRTSDCQWQDQAMISNALKFGSGAKYLSLWFYGENDTVMPVATWRSVFAAYASGGRAAELVPVGQFMADSHQLLSFPEGLPIWTPRVDEFLTRIGLPSSMTHPEYLPKPVPPPSHFAAISDLAAVPWLNDKGRDAYRQFLTRRFPRVFVLSVAGGFAVADGGFDPLSRALVLCNKAGIYCSPYAIDDQVVWAGGKEVPRDFARTVPARQTSTLNFAYSVNPDCTSRGLAKIRISEAPLHGMAAILVQDGHPRFPPAHPFAKCNVSTVAGVAVIYTPAPGFTGSDTLTFEETPVDGGSRLLRIALTIQ
jgi:dienelactone hydrolase